VIWNSSDNTIADLEIGPFSLKAEGPEYGVVLDGLQRFTTLFGCLTNPKSTDLICDAAKWDADYSLCYDLQKENFFFALGKNLEIQQIYAHQLLDTYSVLYFIEELRSYGKVEDLVEKVKELSTTFLDYRIPTITLNGNDEGVAMEVYQRLNPSR
jgi:hypothetical protein